MVFSFQISRGIALPGMIMSYLVDMKNQPNYFI